MAENDNQAAERPTVRSGAPRVGDIWHKNGSDRSVRIVGVDDRWLAVRNTVTGRLSHPEVSTFTRSGKAGWTRVSKEVTA